MQLATAAASLVVGGVVGAVDWSRYTDLGRVIGAELMFLALAIWIFRRGRHSLRRADEPTA
ncbi:MAG TPA: hypothetical protein VHM48_01350 [Candidatus Limnocylindrales bacterium]|nr:hypothetical protein [Candidatus Limnocylindrales bacterium]